MKAAPTAEERTDAELVMAARDQEPGVYGELFRRWYNRCYDVALNILRDREAAADVAQDAFMAGWERLADLREPDAFGGWILRTTRNRALNRLAHDRRRSLEPIDARSEPSAAVPDPDTDPAVVAERHDRRRLVWTAVAVLGERDTSLLDLHLRHGLEPCEIAEELRISTNNASQLLFRLRRKLREAIGAVLLWREGRPRCDDLAALLPSEAPFNLNVATTIRRHQRGCARCRKEVSRQTDPVRMFATVPLAVVPLVLKEKAAIVLAQAGAPMLAPAPAPVAAASSPAIAPHWPTIRVAAIGSGMVALGMAVAIGLWPSGPGQGGPGQGGPSPNRSAAAGRPTTSPTAPVLPITKPTGSLPGSGASSPAAPGEGEPTGRGGGSTGTGSGPGAPGPGGPTATRSRSPRPTSAPPSTHPTQPGWPGWPGDRLPDPRWCRTELWHGYTVRLCFCHRHDRHGYERHEHDRHRYEREHCLVVPGPRWPAG